MALGLIAGKKIMDNIKGNAPQGPAYVDPVKAAEDALRARQATDPAAQALSFKLMTDPSSGLIPTTRFLEQARADLYPNEQATRNALVQSVLQSLTSAEYLPQDVQQGVASQRNIARSNLAEALRTRANLGGGLYGGRAQQEESRAMSELEGQFAEQDVNRLTQNRLNAYNAALPILQLLYPDVAFSSPNFQSVAPSGESVYGQAINSSNIAYQAAQQEAAQKRAMQQALLQALGTAAGGAVGGPGGAAAGSRIGGAMGSGYGPGGYGTGNATQSQILGFNTANYR